MFFDEKALQNYILVTCQGGKEGGLRDKPSKFVQFLIENYF